MSETASLQELVDLNELQAIQDSFAKIVGTSSVIFSPEGERLTQFSNPTGFCSLIQSTEEGKRRCFLSFMEMSQKALELEEPVIHYCFVHGGHFVAPIIIDGEHKGTMFTGQYIPQKFSPEQLKALEKIAVEINVDPTLLVEEAKKMRVVKEDRVWNYSSLLFQIVAIITKLGAQADELNHAKDALQKAYNGLEIRVQERTAELVSANGELNQEISARTHLMKELDNSNRFLESVIENIPDAVYLKDSQYRYSLVNQAYCDLFEVKKEEIIRKERVYETDKEIFQTGKAVEIPEQSFTDHKGKRHYTHLKKVPLIDNSGNVTHVLTISRDITERKRAEELLTELQQYTRALIETSLDPLVTISSDGAIIDVNPAMVLVTGYHREKLIGTDFSDYFTDPQKARQGYQQVFREGDLHDYPLEIKHRDGKVTSILYNASVYHDSKGDVAGVFAAARDITERKRAEEEREKKNEELRRFNKLAVGRELRLIELKKEINALLEDLGKEPRYRIAGEV